jgi:hypothetical protein
MKCRFTGKWTAFFGYLVLYLPYAAARSTRCAARLPTSVGIKVQRGAGHTELSYTHPLNRESGCTTSIGPRPSPRLASWLAKYLENKGFFGGETARKVWNYQCFNLLFFVEAAFFSVAVCAAKCAAELGSLRSA